MALDSVLKELVTRQMAVRESFTQLRLTVAEDHPARDPVLLVDQFEYAVDDNLGWQEESLTAAVAARDAASGPVNLDLVRASLSASNQAHLKLARQFRDELASHRRIADLMRFGKRRGGEWRAWTVGVKAALDQQVQLLDQVEDMLVACWNELTEQAARKSISVHATNIGQITVPQPSLLPVEHGGG